MKSAGTQFASGVITLSVLAMLALGMVSPAWSGTDVGNGFGLVGIVRGQTARLNAVNLGGPDTRPCEVEMTFFDDQGDPLAERGIIIIGGKSASLDLSADQLGGPDTRPGERFQLRAVVKALGGPDTKLQCKEVIVTTLEVFDNETGRTTVLLNPALIRGVDPLPEPPSLP
jgi:hypothetical protein